MHVYDVSVFIISVCDTFNPGAVLLLVFRITETHHSGELVSFTVDLERESHHRIWLHP